MGSSQLVIKEVKQRRLWRQRERQKSNKFRLKKQKLCAYITLFCTFPRHYTTMTWKCLISRFVEDVNRQGNELSSSFSELRYSLLEFNSEKIAKFWRMRENKRDRVEAARLHFLSRRCCLSSLFTRYKTAHAREQGSHWDKTNNGN